MERQGERGAWGAGATHCSENSGTQQRSYPALALGAAFGDLRRRFANVRDLRARNWNAEKANYYQAQKIDELYYRSQFCETVRVG